MVTRLISLITLALVFLAALLTFSSHGFASQDYEPWILVDIKSAQLLVKRKNETLRVFRDIAIGHGGAAKLRVRDDGKTPLGEFEIAWIGEESQFHKFFGLNYPNIERTKHAYYSGEIDRRTYYRIWDALAVGDVPPQNTKLGGYLGIHGLGSRDPKTHREINWTQGCIALTNSQIEELALWLKVGTKVVIR